jgi:hypothetical protein
MDLYKLVDKLSKENIIELLLYVAYTKKMLISLFLIIKIYNYNSMVEKINNYWVCEKCGFKYEDKSWAEKCEAWCKEHKSCNLEIVKHAVKI